MKTSVMVLTLALAACASFPASSNRLLTDQDIARLHPGASRAEVRDLLGATQQVETLPVIEREVWTYKALSQGVWRKDLALQFSSDGLVREILLLDDPSFSGG
jgi:outer membrane protein assembly factor BamE (lipoprotein component of BamABCDE complex)